MGQANNKRPNPDPLIQEIADYVIDYKLSSEKVLQAASICLMDAFSCAIQSLQHKECLDFLGPLFKDVHCEHGVHVPGTNFVLDPVQAAFNFGVMIRWLDFNDTWLAAEWGHPSDNLGGIFAISEYIENKSDPSSQPNFTMLKVLEAMVKAYEIQGVLSLNNSFNRVGLDHVILVRIATCAVVTEMLGGKRDQVINAVTNAWADGGALRVYRHAPNTGPRKSWAAGDATARGVWHAVMSLRGEIGYPTILSETTWGFENTFFAGAPIKLSQPLNSFVIENVLFKVAYPAEFHAQTATEAAIKLHKEVIDRLNEVEKIKINTQESAMRIINKSGPLNNPADRDHCLQYIVAVCLISGELTAQHYHEPFADDPRIDELRKKMVVNEDPRYSEEYLDPKKRSIANSIQVFFKNGEATEKLEIRFPIGHQTRRTEALPLLELKCKNALSSLYSRHQTDQIVRLFSDYNALAKTSVKQFVSMFQL